MMPGNLNFKLSFWTDDLILFLVLDCASMLEFLLGQFIRYL